MSTQPRDVLLGGSWTGADSLGVFQSTNPQTGQPLPDVYPVSSRADVERALEAGKRAAEELAGLGVEPRARFLERLAERIEARAAEIVDMAHRETALPAAPRLAEVELPRTTSQLRQAAAAARDGSWTLPVIDRRLDIRSMYGPLQAPVAVFGPNNFPLAFNSVAGGDFAAALAAGNPVIAKASSSHPGTTRLLAEEAAAASSEAGLPPATVQLLYRLRHEDGCYLVSHPLIGATAYTGSREAGLELKAEADSAGKLIYLELSSINPVFILPGALRERGAEIAAEYAGSALLGSGQFCTNPGIVVLIDDAAARAFLADVARRYEAQQPACLLSSSVASRLAESVAALEESGAERATGGRPLDGAGFRFENTMLQVSGALFLESAADLQREAFGNASLAVLAKDAAEMAAIAASFEGNLTGSIYSHRGTDDDALYADVARWLRPRVGRLLNDKMPTGVAVSPAMNHGGPYPATGHPGFTAVGIPAALRRFAQLECYDAVRERRLPPELRDRNPTGKLWRWIDGAWTTADVAQG